MEAEVDGRRGAGRGEHVAVVDGARTVLSYSSLVDLHQRDGIIQVRLRCWCGTTISHLTGTVVDGARFEAPAA